MKKILLFVSILLVSACTGAMAQLDGQEAVEKDRNTATGTIKEYGSSINAKVGLDNDGDISYLCADSFSKALSRLANMMVRVNGVYFEVEKCLKGESYTILKMPSGRDAIVGELSETKKAYIVKVEGDEEKTTDYKFRRVPEGLAYYKGKKVIVDAVPVTGDEGFYKIVSYMKHPEQ